MGNHLISVIIPVYNVEPYLHRCLDSVISQTYKNLEIILIDDGSTDKSGLICDEYKAKDNRIVVIHQKNQGLSAARNAGLDICKGEYISFVDSDDYVDSNFIEILYFNLSKDKADISVSSVVQVRNNRKCYFSHYMFVDRCFSSHEFLKLAIPSIVCNKLYAKYLFATLRFPVGKHYEDSFIYFSLIYNAKCIVTTSKILYFYCIRSDSITQKGSIKFYLDLFEAKELGIKFILDNNLGNEILNNWFAECYSWFIVCYKAANIGMDTDSKEKILSAYNRVVAMSSNNLNFFNKIKCKYPFFVNFIKPIIKFIFFPAVLIKKCKFSRLKKV